MKYTSRNLNSITKAPEDTISRSYGSGRLVVLGKTPSRNTTMANSTVSAPLNPPSDQKEEMDHLLNSNSNSNSWEGTKERIKDPWKRKTTMVSSSSFSSTGLWGDDEVKEDDIEEERKAAASSGEWNEELSTTTQYDDGISRSEQRVLYEPEKTLERRNSSEYQRGYSLHYDRRESYDKGSGFRGHSSSYDGGHSSNHDRSSYGRTSSYDQNSFSKRNYSLGGYGGGGGHSLYVVDRNSTNHEKKVIRNVGPKMLFDYKSGEMVNAEEMKSNISNGKKASLQKGIHEVEKKEKKETRVYMKLPIERNWRERSSVQSTVSITSSTVPSSTTTVPNAWFKSIEPTKTMNVLKPVDKKGHQNKTAMNEKDTNTTRYE